MFVRVEHFLQQPDLLKTVEFALGAFLNFPCDHPIGTNFWILTVFPFFHDKKNNEKVLLLSKRKILRTQRVMQKIMKLPVLSCYWFNLIQYTIFVFLKGVTDSFDPDKANFSSMFREETIKKQFVLIFSSLLLSFQFSSNCISFAISLFQYLFLVHFNSESVHWNERGRYKGSSCNVGNNGRIYLRDYGA
jgi:hypothetical protein